MYTWIVTGDTNGDGQASITGMLAVRAHILGETKLVGVQFQAEDRNGDGNVSITDFVQIKGKLLGKGEITAR